MRRLPVCRSLVVSIWVMLGLCFLPGKASGVPNVPQTAGSLIAGPFAPQGGRTAVLVYHQGWLFTFPEIPSSSPVTINGQNAPLDYQMRQWDIGDLSNINEVAQLGQTVHGFSAHGAMRTGNWVIFGAYQFHVDSFGGPLVEASYTDSYIAPWAKGNLAPPYGGSTYWSYDNTTGDAEYRFEDQVLARWDHLGQTGVIGQAVIMGNLLFMLSEQSNTGLAIYDMSLYLDGDPGNDPLVPPLLGAQTTGGFGGYWGDLFGMDGRLYAVASYRINGDGVRLIDVTDPSNPGNMVDIRFTAPNSSSMYPQFQDHFCFSGSSKIDMRTQQVVLTLPTESAIHTVPGMGDGDGIDTSQYLLPVGNLLITGGSGGDQRIQGMAVWAHQSAADTAPPTVGYHIPRAGQGFYPVAAPISMLIHETLDTSSLINGDTFVVRAAGGGPALDGSLFFSHTGMLTFQPDALLAQNTTYEVVLRGGGIRDAVGNTINEYSFNFSTGGTVGGNGPPTITGFSADPGIALPGQNVQFSGAADDPDGDLLEYRVIFGDGQTAAWQTSTTFNHVYVGEYHYRAMLQVRDPSGVTRSRLLTVTVATPPAGPFPNNSSTIVLNESQRRVYVVNPDNDSISVVDADSETLIREISTPGEPRSLALDGDGNLWVTAFSGDAVYVVNPASGVIEHTLALDYGDAPFGVVLSPDGGQVYVSLYGRGSLVQINPNTRAITGEVPLGPTPRALAISGDGGRLLVTRFISDYGSGAVWDVRTSDLSLQRTINLHTLIADDNTANGSGVPNYLAGITINPSGSLAWVSTVKANITKGQIFDGTLNDPDNTVRTELIPIDLVTHQTLDDSRRIDLDNSDSAQAVAFSPLGDYLFTVTQGNDSVLVLDRFRFPASQGLGSLVASIPTGAAPRGLVVDGTGQKVFVNNFLGRSMTAFSIADMLASGDIGVDLNEIDTVGGEALPAHVLEGKKTFYRADDPRMSGEGYISCATCHVDGGHDGRTWDFNQRGEGMRNTIPLWGRSGVGHGNVHWTANFNEIQDFENDIRFHFGGTGFMADGDFAGTSDPLGHHKAGFDLVLDNLAAYVTSLGGETLPRSPHRNGDGSATPAAQEGWRQFFEYGCATCHNPAQQYTDRQIHDVGTIREGSSGQRRGGDLPGLETPTLLGLFESAPYFHDGSAKTLADVFRLAGGTWYDNEQAATNGFAPSAWPAQTWMGGSKHPLDQSGRRMTWTGIDGGSGGFGQLVFRYANLYTSQSEMVLTVNGTPRTIHFPQTDQFSTFNREFLLVEDIPLNGGTTNTIELRNNGGPRVQLDAMLVSTAQDVARAYAHHRVSGLSQTVQDELIEFLLHLDGNSVVEAEAVERRFWQNLAGSSLDDLRAATHFPHQPDGADVLYGLQGLGWANSGALGAPGNYGDNYGEQIRGFLVPAQTGTHTFYISGDEQAALYLSTDDDPGNALEIARVPSATGRLTWDTHASQTSVPIELVAGVRYYLEILHKESGGDDHVAVAWRPPGVTGLPPNGGAGWLVPEEVLQPYYDVFLEEMPADPGNLQARGFSISEIDLSFTDGSDNELGHTLQYRIPGNPWIDVPLPSEAGAGATIAHNLSFLAPGTTYELRVSSYNRVGDTSWVGPVTATTHALNTNRVLSFEGADPFRFPGQLNMLQEIAVEDDLMVLWRAGVDLRQRGAVWWKKPIPIDDFDTTFVFEARQLGAANPTRLNFLVQKRSPNEPSSGETGGYDGLFEPKGGLHLGMGSSNIRGMLNGDMETRWNMHTLGFPFNDGARYRVRLTYEGGNVDVMVAYLDNLTTGDHFEYTWDLDLDGTIGGPAYVGFITDNVFNDQRMELFEWTLNSQAAAAASVCNFGIAPSSTSLAAAGGSGTFSVSAGDACEWTAQTADNWIMITAGGGTGNGSVAYSVGANPTGLVRNGTIVAAGRSFQISQDGLPCNASLTPTTAGMAAGGGSGSLAVTLPDGCTWTPVSNANWLTVTSGSGSGDGTISYSVGQNPGASQRSATITAAGQTFSLTQAGSPCVYVLEPGGASIGASGGAASLAVTAPDGCAWTATSNSAWLAVTGGASGSGSGTVQYSVAANSMADGRSGSMTIAGQTFQVSQNGFSCSFSIAPTSSNYTAAGGPGQVELFTEDNCTWNVVNNTGWVNLITRTSGDSYDIVRFEVEPNQSASSRTGTLTIAGQTYRINQAGASCVFTIDHDAASYDVDGGAGQIQLSAPIGCTWISSANVAWISITTGGSGSGAATISYEVDPNETANMRVGEITVAGNTYTVSQDGLSCNLSLSRSSFGYEAAGGTGILYVTTPEGCSWNATSNRSWIQLSGTLSGNGRGNFNFSVSPNDEEGPRTGLIQVNGQNVLISQEYCGVNLEDHSAMKSVSGGVVSIGYMSSCTFGISTSAAWITLQNTTGSGNGLTSLTVGFNSSGYPRVAQVDLGDARFTVRQSGCSGTGFFERLPQWPNSNIRAMIGLLGCDDERADSDLGSE